MFSLQSQDRISCRKLSRTHSPYIPLCASLTGYRSWCGLCYLCLRGWSIPATRTFNNCSKGRRSRAIKMLWLCMERAGKGWCLWCWFFLLLHVMCWRNIWQTEDWQSDKCEVSLLEGVPAPFIIKKLDEAVNWLSQSSQGLSLYFF